MRTSTDRDDFKCSVNVSAHVAQPSLQGTPQENVIEPCYNQGDRNRTTYEERIWQIDELDEWGMHANEKLKKHNEEPKRRHDEHVMRTNQFKVGEKVLLNKTDPQISPSELESNGSNSFTVLNIFPYSTVEVTHSEFGPFKVNNTRLRPYFGKNIVDKKEELRLREPP
ncbi:hypothetical protein GOBAR_DD07045 [Gossypium barbadense]|nr:hypothetical protein GOBAR_DD07045 [Gossypium barbadense]